MLNRDLPTTQTSLQVDPQPLEAILAEDGAHPLSFVLPPDDDLRAIEALKKQNASLDERAMALARERAPKFEQELEEILLKFDRFARSSTYLTRLANLAALSFDTEREQGFLAMARRESGDAFFAHRYADSVLSQGQLARAEQLFRELDLDRDLNANLKLAAFHIRRKEWELAEERVEKALSIDPIDFGALLFDSGLKLLSGRHEAAIRSLRTALEERPTSAAAYLNMAVAYARLDRHDSALGALRKAVALAPLNLKAVFLLADFCFEHRRDEEAIPSLRYLLQFEQKSADGWARLARASLQLKDAATATVALRRQASLGESSRVWNNLGVAYALQRDLERALPAFKQAMHLATGPADRDYFLAARNIAQLLAERELNDELLRFTSAVLKADSADLIRKDDVLSDIYGFYMHGLRRAKRLGQMREVAGQLLRSPAEYPERLIAWTLGTVVAYDTLYESDPAHVLAVFDDWKGWIEKASIEDGDRKAMLFNNVAFALADAGRLDEAESMLSKIASRLHKDPYPTATLGLVSLRRGHIERGVRRYREAIGLARTRLDKSRIRQKLNLELARHYSVDNPSRAKRLLASVVKAGDGEPALVEQARAALEQLTA